MCNKQCVRLYNLTDKVAEEMAFFISVISVTVVTCVFIKRTFFLAMHIRVSSFPFKTTATFCSSHPAKLLYWKCNYKSTT